MQFLLIKILKFIVEKSNFNLTQSTFILKMKMIKNSPFTHVFKDNLW